jgi:2-iminobutanoate/2-iminopropanoate deaminase
MHIIKTDAAPQAGGHYSQGIAHGGLVYVSGQLPLDPVTGEVVGEGDIEVQTERTLRNVEEILMASGSGLDRVVQMTVYITGRALWPQVNAVYARILGDHRPARAVIPVPEIKPGCLIEIQAIAATTGV